MDNRFNLIDEPWIPITDKGFVSLRDVFTQDHLRSLGGSPVQKIALLKLLQAIAQSAATPESEDEWKALGSRGLSEQCVVYLEQWYDRFYLYGDHPFLQVPDISKAKEQDYGAILPEVSSGNTTVLTQVQAGSILGHADRALLLVVQMGFALGGKKTDNSVTLSPGYKGKSNEKGNPSSSKPGPAVAHMGLLHSFVLGSNLQESIWLNLLTQSQVNKNKQYPAGLGRAPWEHMPAGEDCQIARELKRSLIGRLVPVSRFCLLKDEGLHYSEGLAHPSYLQGVSDPSVAINEALKKPKALWTNPEKRPWRELTALLSFIGDQSSQGFQCWQLRYVLDRARDVGDQFAIWSGGLKVSSNAGEQYVSGVDDFVESVIWLRGGMLGETWFLQLQLEMNGLDAIAKKLYGCVLGYYKEQTADGSSQAALATHLFWQLCEEDFQKLVDSCDQDETSIGERQKLRRRFASYAHQSYDQLCPNDTARQLDAWANRRPNISSYLKEGI